MNTLKIQQGQTVETVTTSIINKLYEAALSVSEPLEGEEDNAYLSGNLQVGRASQNKVKYLAGTVLVRGAGNINNNPEGRFHDLKINITDEYYIDFEDNAIENTLITGGFSSDGYGVTISDAANATFTDSTFAGQWNDRNTTITKFNEFEYFTKANNNPPTGLFRYCPNFAEIDLSNCTRFSQYEFADTALQVVNAPLLQTTDEEPFNGCSQLTTVTNLGSVISTIATGMFKNCPNLQTVNLPLSVTLIGNQSFCNETNVESSFTTITGTQNVTEVRYQAFYSQHSLVLDSSYFPELTTVGNQAFYGCYNFTGNLNLPKLTSIGQSSFRLCRFPKVINLGKVTSIPLSCFQKNNQTESILTEVYLPYECTSIGSSAFRQNKALTTIKQYTDSIDNWVEGQTPTYGNVNRITLIGSGAFQDCTNLPGGIDFGNVTNIEEYAFCNCTSFVGPLNNISNLTSIGNAAFSNCPQLTGTLNNISSLTTIGSNVFRDCTSFSAEVNLPNLTTLGKAAFCNSGITRVTNLGSITSLQHASTENVYYGVFKDCSDLVELVIPNTVTYIGNSTFKNTSSLTTFNIDYSVITEIQNYAFQNVGCNLGVINLENLTTVGLSLFGGSTAEAVYIPKLTTTNKGGYYNNTTDSDGLFAHSINYNRPVVNGIVYFRDIQKFYPGDFSDVNIGKIVINNITPPTFCNQNDKPDSEANNNQSSKDRVFQNTNIKGVSGKGVIGGIYVPDAAISTYQNNSDWGSYSSFIHPISDLSTVATKAAWDQLSAQAKLDTLIEEYM